MKSLDKLGLQGGKFSFTYIQSYQEHNQKAFIFKKKDSI